MFILFLARDPLLHSRLTIPLWKTFLDSLQYSFPGWLSPWCCISNEMRDIYGQIQTYDHGLYRIYIRVLYHDDILYYQWWHNPGYVKWSMNVTKFLFQVILSSLQSVCPINLSPPEQNGHHFVDIFKYIFVNDFFYYWYFTEVCSYGSS